MFLIRNIRFLAIFHAPPRRSSSARIARGSSLSVGFLLIRPSPPMEKGKAARRVRLGHPTATLFSIFFSAVEERGGGAAEVMAHRALYIRRDLETSQGPQFRKGDCVDADGGMFRSPVQEFMASPRLPEWSAIRRCASNPRMLLIGFRCRDMDR